MAKRKPRPALTKNGKRIGRPPHKPPPKLCDEIIEWISAGQTLRDFCRQKGKPARRTIDYWREKDESFAARFARARLDGFDVLAEETLAIADTQEQGVIVTEDDDGTQTVTEDMLGHRKLRIETRLKLLAKWDPSRYGDRMAVDAKAQVEHSGSIEITGPPVPASADLLLGIRRLGALADELLNPVLEVLERDGDDNPRA